MILVTGGAGFIGGNFVHHWCEHANEAVLVLDKLADTGHALTLESLVRRGRVTLVQGDILDRPLLARLLAAHRPRAVVHCAAESHVDRSIRNPGAFVDNNVSGTFALLEEIFAYWSELREGQRAAFRLLHVSTDEVYGSLEASAAPLDERAPYAPNSPYAATKAASDHLVRSYHRTYGLPVVTTHGSNTYGPYHFPEKLIPMAILHALEGRPIPVYGDGGNLRDWIHVRDHCEALRLALNKGRIGETYNVGEGETVSNLHLVETLCALLDEIKPRAAGPHRELITLVADRPGHDRRYAISAAKLREHTGWRAIKPLREGLRETIHWMMDNPVWIAQAQTALARPQPARRAAFAPR